MQALTKLILVASLLATCAQSASALDYTSLDNRDYLFSEALVFSHLMENMGSIHLGFSQVGDPDNKIALEMMNRYLDTGRQPVITKAPRKSALKRYWDWRCERHKNMVRIRPMMIMPIGRGYMVF